MVTELVCDTRTAEPALARVIRRLAHLDCARARYRSAIGHTGRRARARTRVTGKE
jgi:hypothetical protein